MGKNNRSDLYAVIGDPIAHSLSPDIHNFLFEEFGHKAKYIPLRVRRENLEKNLPLFKDNFSGFNVTAPHKEAIVSCLSEQDKTVRFFGAANTVKVEQKGLTGYNTDGYGFLKSLQVHDINLDNKKVLILGCGGAARVVALELLKFSSGITVANRTRDRASALITRLREENKKKIELKEAGLEEIKSENYSAVINTIPQGSDPGIAVRVVQEMIFKKAELAYDLTYSPPETEFLKTAQKYGCKKINGLAMLFFQALKAYQIWFEREIEEETIFSLYRHWKTETP